MKSRFVVRSTCKPGEVYRRHIFIKKHRWEFVQNSQLKVVKEKAHETGWKYTILVDPEAVSINIFRSGCVRRRFSRKKRQLTIWHEYIDEALWCGAQEQWRGLFGREWGLGNDVMDLIGTFADIKDNGKWVQCLPSTTERRIRLKVLGMEKMRNRTKDTKQGENEESVHQQQQQQQQRLKRKRTRKRKREWKEDSPLIFRMMDGWRCVMRNEPTPSPPPTKRQKRDLPTSFNVSDGERLGDHKHCPIVLD